MNPLTTLARSVVGLPTRSDPLISLDEWASYFSFGGNLYPMGLNQTLNSTQEQIGPNFDSLITQAYQQNAVVFACVLTRLKFFSQARFQFQHMADGTPGDLFGGTDGRNPAYRGLSLLAHPWPGATTGDLLARALQHADLAGNGFLALRSGPRIRPIRPNWVTIVLGSSDSYEQDAWDLDAEVVGYIYHPGGRYSGKAPEVLLREEVAHFAPYPDPMARYRGMSWMTPIIREIMADSAATTHKLKFFENGATPNLIVSMDKSILPDKFREWIAMFEQKHTGVFNAYKTLYLGAGAVAQPVGTNLQQLDFKVTQGAGETRIAAAAGIHPSVVGLSEGLQGSTLNAGNFGATRRLVAEGTLYHLWQNICGSLEVIVPPPPAARLWFDERTIPFLREDRKDAADIQQVKASTIATLLTAGYIADSVTAAVESEDMSLLKHSGLFSVQLQAPGSTKMPVGEVPGELPVGGVPGLTTPETIPGGDVSTKPLAAGSNGKVPKP
jgi:hypothetical protein